jgi:hypothetical protein
MVPQAPLQLRAPATTPPAHPKCAAGHSWATPADSAEERGDWGGIQRVVGGGWAGGGGDVREGGGTNRRALEPPSPTLYGLPLLPLVIPQPLPPHTPHPAQIHCFKIVGGDGGGSAGLYEEVREGGGGAVVREACRPRPAPRRAPQAHRQPLHAAHAHERKASDGTDAPPRTNGPTEPSLAAAASTPAQRQRACRPGAAAGRMEARPSRRCCGCNRCRSGKRPQQQQQLLLLLPPVGHQSNRIDCSSRDGSDGSRSTGSPPPLQPQVIRRSRSRHT